LVIHIRAVKGIRQEGTRSGNWLAKHQAQQLLKAPDTGTLKGLRDRAVLALLLGCGLRRAEAASLTFDHIQQRDGRWVLVDLLGKRKKLRSVPMPAWTKAAIDEYAAHAGLIKGNVFRPVNKGGRTTGERMTEQAIYNLVIEYAQALGFGRLAPHDLRRTFAKLAHKGGAGLDQIQLSLGHGSIQTTERYLGTEDLTDAPCDHLGLRL
jgi:integrase